MAVARTLLAITLILGICACAGERLTDVAPGGVGIADAEPVSSPESVEWAFQWETQYADGTSADMVLIDDANARQATVSCKDGQPF